VKLRSCPLLLVGLLLAKVALAGRPAPADNPQAPVKGWEVMTSSSEARGLYDQAALEWARAALAAPASPGAELALRRLAATRTRFAASKPLIGVLEDLSRKKDATPVVSFLARQLLVDYLRERGEWRDAAKLAARLGYVRNWTVVGTFGRNIAATHDRSFGPEHKLDLTDIYDAGRYCALFKPGWRVLPLPLLGNRLRPYDYLRPRGGAAYLLAQIKSDEVRRGCWLWLETPSAFKLWVNGSLLLDGDRYRRSLPRETATRLTLRKGYNRILIKLSGPASLRVRLTDSAGRPLNLPSEKKALLHPAPPAVPGHALSAPAPAPPSSMTGVRAAENAASSAALGLLRGLQDLDDDAIHHLRDAVRLDPKRAAWHFLLGEAYRQAQHLSAPSRSNLSARAYRACLQIDRAFVPALMRLAETSREENNEEEALARLKRAAAASPGCYLARLRMAEIAVDLNWRNQAKTWLAEAQKLRPDYAGCRLLEARLQRKAGQLDRAISEYREMVKADATSRRLRELLGNALVRKGQWRKAIRLARDTSKLWPRDVAARRGMLTALVNSGKHEEVVAACAPLLELVPNAAKYHALLGEALMAAGKRKAALAAYAKSLELDPGDHRLRRMVERASGIDEDFSAAYPLDIKKEIAESRKRGYPRANAVRVLDQTVVRVYRDGSIAETIANGEMALTPSAVNKLGSQPIYGEIMEARTIRKDGSILEPTPIPGQRRLTMPGLEIGATVEYKYRLDRKAAAWGGFYLNKWYFRSPQLDEPHHVSDYIVMIPKGLAHKVVRHNFNVPERVEEKAGLIVYRWTARFRPRVNAEPHMSHFDHYLPFVELGTQRDWQDVAESFRSVYLGRTRPTRLIVETTRRICAGRKTPAEKTRALYDFVNSHVKYRGPYLNAHQVLAAGSGDREMIFLALAETAGLTIYQGRTRKATRFQGRNDRPATWSLPSEDLFTAELIGVSLDGGEILWLDLSNRFMPFGQLRDHLAGARVLAIPSRGGAFFERLPEPRFDRMGSGLQLDLRIAADGSLSGKARSRTAGFAGALAKERLSGLDANGRRAFVLNLVNRAFKAARLDTVALPGAERPGTPLIAQASFFVENHLLPAAGGRLICPAGLTPMNLASALAMDSDRNYPLKLAQARIARETVRFRLAPKLEVVSLPAGTVLSGEFGTYSLTVTRTADGFRLERRALLLPQTVSARKYPAFRAFCRKIDEAEKFRIVLRRRIAK
jgi:tetratricopeptide (TPR) repeat protein